MSRASLEESPLLGEESAPQKHNPLPWRQLLLVFFIEFCGDLPAQSIRPYINQRISQLDVINGDVRNVGYYVGLMGSLVNISSAATVLQWSQLSDRIGRKPVLLFGLFGTTVSIFWFGLARTYWGLVVSLCLQGVINGNHGVVRSTIGETTNAANRSQVFLLVFVLVFAAATFAGSLIGGILVMPHERFPNVFSGDFWRQNPYFLPSLVVSIFVVTVFVSTVIYFKESAPGKLILTGDFEVVELSQAQPLPLRELVAHRPAVISAANYATVGLLGASHDTLLPLFLAMPINVGGLGLSPARIGLILGTYRAVTAFMIILFSGKLIHRIGERRIYIFGMTNYLLTWTMLPVISLCARYFGVGIVVWTLIVIMVLPLFFMDMAGGCLNTFIVVSSPNRQSLGVTNGFAQSCKAISTILAPVVADSLFSFSVQHNILGGYAVYPTLFALTSLAISLAQYLPHDIRPVWEREE